ncbi:branched-chain amino acid ABC transporter permease [Streptomyces phaeolivaceus]|uniref:Branched-chain amino acid ABC transporter permease n=1 Tax=Streptomyces phaeolivaceus TaxID=2653200 RepID=A0A5P8JWZ5_9ACTN|nr:branched-chain amino acid ABC transporter permease [Streptomyces phaeolivaceus]QFQ94947.1 branched-chain amino acid ABC transporter permease [Streptomyces phaeolivaceus]
MSLDVLAAGILAGGLYALIGLGISLVFGVLGLMNLAHGELVIGGAYLASLLVVDAGWDPLAALPLAMATMALIAYPLQRYLLTPLLRGSKSAPLVATFGLSLLAQALFQAAFGTHPKALPAAYADTGLSVLGVRVQTVYVIAFGLTVLLCAATHLVLTRTRAGSAVRAASADPDTAAVLGIDVNRVYAVTFAGAAALAAAGGVLTGVAQSFTPSSGLPLLLTGFAVMALAGIGSVGGVLAAGVALGVLQSVSVGLFGGGWRDVVVYLAFFLVLAVRPQGLFRKAHAG